MCSLTLICQYVLIDRPNCLLLREFQWYTMATGDWYAFSARPTGPDKVFFQNHRILTKLTTFFHSLCNILIETRSGAWQSHHRLLEVEKAWLAFNRTLRTSPTCQIFSNISHVVSHPFVIFRTASTRVKSLYLENVLRVIFYFTLRHDIYQNFYTSYLSNKYEK